MSNDRRVRALVLSRCTLQGRSATLSQAVADHIQLDILLFVHVKCCFGIDNSKIMLQVLVLEKRVSLDMVFAFT